MYCFACGEPMPEAEQSEDQCLFHCARLQGVILGVGLTMVEQSFVGEVQEKADGKTGKVTAGRRRKATTTPSPNGANDDDDFLVDLPTFGKKAKLGVGYAGDVREDVSHPLFDIHTRHEPNKLDFRLPASSKHKLSRTQKTRSSPRCSRAFGYISRICAARAVASRVTSFRIQLPLLTYDDGSTSLAVSFYATIHLSTCPIDRSCTLSCSNGWRYAYIIHIYI